MLGSFSSPVDIFPIDIGKLAYQTNELFNSVIRLNFYELMFLFHTSFLYRGFAREPVLGSQDQAAVLCRGSTRLCPESPVCTEFEEKHRGFNFI